MEITFIRHGQSEANVAGVWQGQTDSPLSAGGRRQAEALAARLAARPYHLVVASDLSRAEATARALGPVVETDAEWREMAIGEWENLSREEIRRRYPDAYAALLRGEHIRLGGGETFPEFEERIVGALDKLRSRLDRGERAAVVSHGGAIAALTRHVLGLEGWPQPVGRLENTSLTTFAFGEVGAELSSYNDAGHLGPLGGWAAERLAAGDTVVTLFRHGQTDANVADRWQGTTDGALTADGGAQVAALAHWYGGLDALYSSPLGRARDTAAALAERHGIAVAEHDSLTEMRFGEWEDLTTAEIRQGWAELWREIYEEHQDLPRGHSGEALEEVAARMNGALAELAHRHAGARVGVVTHGGAIRAYALDLLGLEHRRRDRVGFVANASVSHVVVSEDGPRLADYNVVAPLAG